MDAPAPFNLASMGGPATPDFGNVQPSPATSDNMATITVTPPEQVAAQADVAHHALLGKLATNLMGMNTSYQVDPSTGSLVAQQSPNKPGMFFRSVLAASLLGGAAGADGNPNQGFMGGLVRGAGAGMASANQQDALKRQQAQQQYANQLAAQKNQREQNQDQREADAAVTTDSLRKAQITQANAETYKTNVLTQGADLKTHQETAQMGLNHFNDFKAAGLQPVVQDVPESEMKDLIQNRPGASTFDWEATGVKEGKDANGNPTHEYTYTAYDPKGQIPVSQAVIDQWKKDGMDKFYPDLFKIVKAGSPLDATQYIALKQKDAQLYNDNLTRTKNDEAQKKAAADVGHVQAETNQSNAAAVKDYAEAGKAREEAKQLKDGGETNADGYKPEQIADAVAQGKGTFEQLTQGMGKEAAAFRRKVEGAFLQKYPTLNMEAFKAWGRQAENTSTQNQMSAARGLFGSDGTPGAFDIIDNALKAVPKAPLPMLSNLRQHTAYALGSPEMATLKRTQTDVATELAKFNSGGGSVTSDTQLGLALEQFKSAETPEQIAKGMADLRKIASSRLHGVVGKNPYLDYMTKDINDPVTKQPRGVNAVTGLPDGNGQKIDANTAASFLKAAGGDKDKARQLAQQHKWSF